MLTLSLGETLNVVAIARDPNGEPVEVGDARWSLSGTHHGVTVTPGAGMAASITAHSPGVTEVGCDVETLTEPTFRLRGTVSVAVRDVESITFSENPLLMDPGDSRQLVATLKDGAGASSVLLSLSNAHWTIAPPNLLDITWQGTLNPTVEARQPGLGSLTLAGERRDGKTVTGTLPVRVAGPVTVEVVEGS